MMNPHKISGKNSFMNQATKCWIINFLLSRIGNFA